MTYSGPLVTHLSSFVHSRFFMTRSGPSVTRSGPFMTQWPLITRSGPFMHLMSCMTYTGSFLLQSGLFMHSGAFVHSDPFMHSLKSIHASLRPIHTLNQVHSRPLQVHSTTPSSPCVHTCFYDEAESHFWGRKKLLNYLRPKSGLAGQKSEASR